jgi:hypothetical protein
MPKKKDAIPEAVKAALPGGLTPTGPMIPAVTLDEFVLRIPVARLNSMIECMGGGPFKLVQDHIAFIEKQATAQVAAAQKKANGDAKKE